MNPQEAKSVILSHLLNPKVSLKWHDKKQQEEIHDLVQALTDFVKDNFMKSGMDDRKKEFIEWVHLVLEEIEREYEGRRDPKVISKYTTEQINGYLRRVASWCVITDEHNTILEILTQGYDQNKVKEVSRKLIDRLGNLTEQRPKSPKEFAELDYLEMFSRPFAQLDKTLKRKVTWNNRWQDSNILVDTNILKQLFLDDFREPDEEDIRRQFDPSVFNILFTHLGGGKYTTQSAALELWQWSKLREKWKAKKIEIESFDNVKSAPTFLGSLAFDKSYGRNVLTPESNFKRNLKRFMWQRNFYKNYFATHFKLSGYDENIVESAMIFWMEYDLHRISGLSIRTKKAETANLLAIFVHYAIVRHRLDISKELEKMAIRTGREPKSIEDFENNLYCDLQLLYLALVKIYLQIESEELPEVFTIYTNDNDFNIMKDAILWQINKVTTLPYVNEVHLETIRFFEVIKQSLQYIQSKGNRLMKKDFGMIG